MQSKSINIGPALRLEPARRRWETPRVVVSQLASHTSSKLNFHLQELKVVSSNSIATHSS